MCLVLSSVRPRAAPALWALSDTISPVQLPLYNTALFKARGSPDLHDMLCVESQVRDHFLSPRFPIVEPIFNMSTSVHLSVHTFPLWLEVTWLVAGSLSLSLCQTELSELIFCLGRSICVDVSNLDDISPSYCSPPGPLISTQFRHLEQSPAIHAEVWNV